MLKIIFSVTIHPPISYVLPQVPTSFSRTFTRYILATPVVCTCLKLHFSVTIFSPNCYIYKYRLHFREHYLLHTSYWLHIANIYLPIRFTNKPNDITALLTKCKAAVQSLTTTLTHQTNHKHRTTQNTDLKLVYKPDCGSKPSCLIVTEAALLTNPPDRIGWNFCF